MSLAYSQGKFDPKHPVITQSFLSLFSDCAYAAYKRYIKGEIVPPGIALVQGTAVDAAVTLGCDSVIKTGEDASLPDKKALAHSIFMDRILDAKLFSDDDVNAAGAKVLEVVELHHRQVAPRLRPVATQMSIVSDKGGYSLAGTIDIVEENHLLVDTKTAKRAGDYPAKGILQRELYTKLYEEKTGYKPSGFRFDVLVKSKTPVVEQVMVHPRHNMPHVLEHVISSSLIELNTSLKMGQWRIAKPNHWKCNVSGKWCGYLYTGCPKGKV